MISTSPPDFKSLASTSFATPAVPTKKERQEPPPFLFPVQRAGNGTRTRDPNLGKVVLYQLSYSRMPLIYRHLPPSDNGVGVPLRTLPQRMHGVPDCPSDESRQ